MANSIGVIVGSLRKGAFSRHMADAAKFVAPAGTTLIDIAIGELPLYNQDLETDSPPAAWTEFRNKVKAVNAVLIVTPEYNRGMPGALKNAFDVGSRPWGHSVWAHKPTAVISITPGALGAMSAHNQVRHTLSVLNSPTLPGPEMYIPGAGGLFDESGKLKNDETRKLVEGFMQAFDKWMQRFK